MGLQTNLTNELQSIQYSSFPEIFEKFKSLSQQYGNLPVSNLIQAFQSVNGVGSMYTPNPYIQNRRVKGITSLPRNFSKDSVAEMLTKPDDSEQPLREVEHALEYTSYPLFHTRKVYQELLTYHNYIAPHLTDKEESQKDEFWREWKLLEKLRVELNPAAYAHEIVGQTLQEGKVFYYPRISVDKSHNKVNYAFLQQLPSDWVKIVGFNNKSKYTIAFNLMYFTQPGTDPRQFGELFLPYLHSFYEVVTPTPRKAGGKIIYASKTGINLSRVHQLGEGVEAYFQNGRWFYWVTLPADSVFPFESDDVTRNAISPFSGLFLDMIQLSQLSAIQLELVQNPLVSVLTGEIPYFESKDTNTADQYKLSNAGRQLFESLWYAMLAANNTSGIGLFAAPFENMELHSLAESPSAMDIVSQGYTDTMAKAGLTGIIPTSDDARAGAVQVSLQIESKFATPVYTCMERMINVILEKLNLKYSWKFHMFGDIATDKELEENCRNAMTLGILPAVILYNSLYDRSVLDDIAWSDAIMNSSLLDRRIPLVSSYTASQDKSGLPPQASHSLNPGGRPTSDGEVTSEGQEADIDSLLK